MKIRTQLILSTAVFALVLFLIVASVIGTNQKLDRLIQQDQIANTLEQGANDIGYLSSEYLLHPGNLQHSRWDEAYASFSSALATFESGTPEQQTLVANIRYNQQGLREVFDSVALEFATSPAPSSLAEGSILQVSWSRMAVQTQGMVADTAQLSHIIDSETLATTQMVNLLIFALLGTFIAFLFTSSYLFYRRTLSSIAELHEGTKVIGSGNLDHIIPEKGDDEIRDLVRAFNQMTVNLRGVTASKADLEREVIVRKKAEEDLGEINEELTATQEELHQNLDELTSRERELNSALTEKEALLSEIHHRVKNNLAAFISLLSLQGSIEDTPEGKRLKLDLQNRARSMALVHETLYRTHMYDAVDMGMYLDTLLDQIAGSLQMTKPVKRIVDAHGVMLDISRATPAGLIINELVTNSFKYAFPESFDSMAVRHAPPSICITLSKTEGMFELIFRDNGIGLPPGIDLATTQTLGLKLVNFLAKHQMRAKIEVHSNNGTEFIFRFKGYLQPGGTSSKD
jgi:two-component sensor histidine kinase/HAMP domain-containing protein